MLELYLGGARSGKSRLAEIQAEKQATLNHKHLVYVATATAGDEEMAARIKQHQYRRLGLSEELAWRTVEEPFELANTLIELNDEKTCIVVDCLTLWISNLLLDPSSERWPIERKKLLDCLCYLNSHIIFVSNEVGQGIVPDNELSRRFVDESGFLHQDMAMLCDRVVFTVAGLAQILKGQALQSLASDHPCAIGVL